MRKRTFWLVLGALCATTSLAASSAFAAVDAKPQAKVAAGGTVVFGADQEPRTLNIFTVEGNALWGSLVLQPVMTLATKYNNKGVLIFDLFESATLNSKKPMVVTYKIKQAAKWSDNKPITADDVIFTQARIMDPKNTIASRVGNEDISKIQKVNSKTLKMTFSKPFAAWRSLWGRILPAHAAGGIDAANFDQSWRNGPPIANGPFRLANWSRGSSMTLTRNPNYWGKKASVNSIVFRFIPDTNTQFQAMRGGEVQIINPQPQQQIADIAKQSNITVQRASQFTWEHVDFQLGAGGHPALKKKFVREAIVTGINRGSDPRSGVRLGCSEPAAAEQRHLQELPERVPVAQVPAVRLQPEEGDRAASGERLHRRSGDAVGSEHGHLLVPGRREALVRLPLDGWQPVARDLVPGDAGAAAQRRHRAQVAASASPR